MMGFVRGVFLLLLPITAVAQAGDTTFVDVSRKSAIDFYHATFIKQSALFNGTLYQPYGRITEGHVFLGEDDFREGAIEFEGVTYGSVSLKYDLLQDAVLTEKNGTIIRLAQEHISFFHFAGRHFVRLEATSANRAPKTSFYEVLYDGPTTAYALHKKEIDARANLKVMESTKYFVVRNGALYPVRNRSSVLKLFPEKSKEIKQRLAAEGIHFRENVALGIAAIARIYDQLKQTTQ
ncbi:MAG: hypothetical protein K1X47_09645 [Cyclobacteriaceae bacterium]|nr:hypothetical protein [Cyclobacteriaceae bacterium]